MGELGRSLIRWLSALAPFAPAASFAQSPQVTLAGMAYAGDAQCIPARFPFFKRYEAELQAGNDSPYQKTRSVLTETSPQYLQLTPNQAEDLKGRDPALVVALVTTRRPSLPRNSTACASSSFPFEAKHCSSTSSRGARSNPYPS